MQQISQFKTPAEVVEKAQMARNKTLRDFIPEEEISEIEAQLQKYGSSRRGFLGNLVEQYVFGLKNNARPEADFSIANVELKTTPLKKHKTARFAAKERLVFSMIDYGAIVSEKWETSSFLKKNRLLLLMFYLWLKEQSILDYEFKFVHFLDLLEGLSEEDVLQIRKDWEFIVDKIRRKEAHLLSEGDTFYLGACTKAANSRVVRDQAGSRIPAKPRAFSLKQTYLNYLIQTQLLGKHPDEVSIFKKGQPRNKTVNQVVEERFRPYIGKTDTEIKAMLGWKGSRSAKNYKRLLVNHILTGTGSNRIEELDKADITLRVPTLEPNGTLKESVSFPAFDFRDLITQVWYDEKEEVMSEFHAQLETQKFLFAVFQKQKGSKEIVLRKVMFWNFPAADMDKARDVWEQTVECIRDGKVVKEIQKQKGGKEKVLTHFPGQAFNGVVHVRPHGRNKKDTKPLPVPDRHTGRTAHTKQCFWLNASYIQHAIESAGDQG
jgi:DNA mismatch repair protein MutH